MDINASLGFVFDPHKFEGYAKRAFNDAVVSRNIQRLKEASDKIVDEMGELPDVNIDEMLAKLRQAMQANIEPGSVNLIDAEKRILSYNLNLNWEYTFLKYCLDVISREWKVTFLRGLIHSLMANWEEGEPDNQSLLLYIIMEHIAADQSKTAEFLRPLKDEIADPYLLGRQLKKKGESIQTACSIFGLPANRIVYPYFTGVIVSYYEKVESEKMDELFNILKTHNSIKADKIILPIWIISFWKKKQVPSLLADFTIKRIGDPFLKEKWAPFPFASREVQENLEETRRILAITISSKIINIFFKNLCQDADRRRFWLKYTDKVVDFNVYGTEVSRQTIAPYVGSQILKTHFHTVATNTTNCALSMSIGKYRIIEFTDTGALYVYEEGASNFKRVFGSRIEKLDDLKTPSFNVLVDLQSGYYPRYNNEGRMVHTGYWQTRLSKWISRKID